MQSKLGDSIIISGSLPRDADFRLAGDKQIPLCKFGVKVGERENGDSKDAIWVNCVCWRNVADATANLIKGDTVLAIGKLQTRNYEGKEGEQKTSTELVCEFVSKMESVERDYSVTNYKEPANDFVPVVNDSELPF